MFRGYNLPLFVLCPRGYGLNKAPGDRFRRDSIYESYLAANITSFCIPVPRSVISTLPDPLPFCV